MARKSNASLPLLKSHVSVSVVSVPSRMAVGVTVRKLCKIALVSVPEHYPIRTGHCHRVNGRCHDVGSSIGHESMSASRSNPSSVSASAEYPVRP